MKRIMKVAALTACVGAMLCFVGCGKGDTDKGAVVDSNATSNIGSVKGVTAKQGKLSPTEELVNFTRQINAELAKHGADPLISEEEVADKVKKTSLENAQKQLVQIKSTFPLLMSYSSVVKEVNDICNKRGGNPYIDKDNITEKFRDFMMMSDEKKRAEIADAQDLLKRLKAVGD